MFGYPFFRPQQQTPRYYAPSQNPQKRYVRDEYGNVYLVPESSSYYPRNINPEEYYYPNQQQQQRYQRQPQQPQRFNPFYQQHEEEEDDVDEEEISPLEDDYPSYHYRRPVPTPRKQQHPQPQQSHTPHPQKQQTQSTRIPINTHFKPQQPQQPKPEEAKAHSLADQTKAAVLIQKIFRGRRVRKDSPIAKLSTLHSTQKTANDLFIQADNENILEEGHVFESNTPCVGNIPRSLAQLDHELTKLLLVLDGVGSGSSEEVQNIVRSKRKEVAQNIELMLNAVDAAKRTCVIRPVETEQPHQFEVSTDTTSTSEPTVVDVEMQSLDDTTIEEADIQLESQTLNTLPLSSETTTTPQTIHDDTLTTEPSHNQPFLDDAPVDITPQIVESDEIEEEEEESNNETILPFSTPSDEEPEILQDQQAHTPITSTEDTESEDWVVLPADSLEMETTPTIQTPTPTITTPTTKTSQLTIPSLKHLSYNACDKLIRSALLRTPVAC
eukprot:TRINITY_DN2591_c0_g1_i14.p1 TRINITY_DN2591_c0_g1~~TRINITY_DN2591_c0_g1_i14.p1  ORF type:complete len:497 (-),score=161.19 TRINITY_DN2591_c0_g1_i14:180-1670(-)